MSDKSDKSEDNRIDNVTTPASRTVLDDLIADRLTTIDRAVSSDDPNVVNTMPDLIARAMVDLPALIDDRFLLVDRQLPTRDVSKTTVPAVGQTWQKGIHGVGRIVVIEKVTGAYGRDAAPGTGVTPNTVHWRCISDTKHPQTGRASTWYWNERNRLVQDTLPDMPDAPGIDSATD